MRWGGGFSIMGFPRITDSRTLIEIDPRKPDDLNIGWGDLNALETIPWPRISLGMA